MIDGLRNLDSSAWPRVAYASIAERYAVPMEEIEGTTKGGQSKFENKVGWARFYLAKAGPIDTEQRGVWVLTMPATALPVAGISQHPTHWSTLTKALLSDFPAAGSVSD